MRYYKTIRLIMMFLSSLMVTSCGIDFSMKSDKGSDASSELPVGNNKLLQVDIGDDGSLPDGAILNRASISEDGRYVVFASHATNLVQNDTNGAADIFVRDLVENRTRRISLATNGTQANGGSDWPEISGNGRYVTFSSAATNLVALDTNGKLDVFRHDLITEETIIISRRSDGTQSNGDSKYSSLNFSGDLVAFASKATNLDLSITDLGVLEDAFVYTVADGSIILVSEQRTAGVPNGNASNGSLTLVYFSPDNFKVIFNTTANNIVAGDTELRDSIMINLVNGNAEKIDLTSDGDSKTSGESWLPRFSKNGKYISFHGIAGNYLPAELSAVHGTFRKNLETGELERASVPNDGLIASGHCAESDIDADGDKVFFKCNSNSANYIEYDFNAKSDILMRSFSESRTVLVSKLEDGGQLDGDSNYPRIAATGSAVVFISTAANVPASSVDGLDHVFVKYLDNIMD